MNGYSFVAALIAARVIFVVVKMVCVTYQDTRPDTIHKTVDDLRRRLLRQEEFAGRANHRYELERSRANHHREKARKARRKLFEALAQLKEQADG